MSSNPELIRSIFAELDADGSGSLDYDEVKAGLEKINMPKIYANSVFAFFRKHKSEEISLEDFTAWARKKDESAAKVFKSLDKDNSGTIDAKELKSLLYYLDIKGDPKDIIKSLDKNDDGVLSYEEFRTGFALLTPVDFSHMTDTFLEIDSFEDAAGVSGVCVCQTAKSENESVPGWTNAAAGAFGNAFSRTVIAPLERIRMQMIVDPGKYSGMGHCMRSVYAKEGIKGFWAGNTINVMRIAPQGAIGFFAKDHFKAKIAGEGNRPTPIQTLLASMASGVCCQTGVYPLDIVRTRLMTSPGAYSGLFDALRKISTQEGPSALFKGIIPANCFAVCYYGTQFFTYDMLKLNYATWGRELDDPRPVHPLIGIPFGSIANCVACFVGFPAQMAWKRIQTQGVGGRPILYSGPVDCLVKVVKTEGIKGVFAGMPANMVKNAPMGALTFWAVEQIKDVMGWRPGMYKS